MFWFEDWVEGCTNFSDVWGRKLKVNSDVIWSKKALIDKLFRQKLAILKGIYTEIVLLEFKWNFSVCF